MGVTSVSVKPIPEISQQVVATVSASLKEVLLHTPIISLAITVTLHHPT